jgi:hypothetical protein
MIDVIVLIAIVCAVLFTAAWVMRPDLRAWIERPKYRFQSNVQSYDQSQRAGSKPHGRRKSA